MCSNPYCDEAENSGTSARRGEEDLTERTSAGASLPSFPVAAGERRLAARPLAVWVTSGLRQLGRLSAHPFSHLVSSSITAVHFGLDVQDHLRPGR